MSKVLLGGVEHRCAKWVSWVVVPYWVLEEMDKEGRGRWSAKTIGAGDLGIYRSDQSVLVDGMCSGQQQAGRAGFVVRS